MRRPFDIFLAEQDDEADQFAAALFLPTKLVEIHGG
jgi:hypothetical protein